MYNNKYLMLSDHWMLQTELRVLLVCLPVDVCSGVCLTTSAVITA